jgi:DNA repair exonuclease SbcCD ATPase subunit
VSKVRIKTKKPWIGYPGSTVQQNYAEDAVRGYLLWEITDKSNYDVRFCELPNPKPFITIEWFGDVSSTVHHAKKNFPLGSRFRVHSRDTLAQKDVIEITQSLRDTLQATEVTFKTDHHVSRDIIISHGATQVVKDDLRNPDVLVRLLKEYHHEAAVSAATWANVLELVKGYLAHTGADEVVRNTKWSLRHLKFDNTLAYGEGNVINFENLNGIVGIFGPNRSGKSSIVGTVMYALHNSTDRGSIKNLHVINARKPYCYARAIITVNGTDYVIERQTVKNEDKRGKINASTALNVFRMEDGEVVDLGGEQRNDTEKTIRKLIGSADDFLLTSLSAQDEIKMFILQGSTRRRQILSRFLDLDIFDRMYDMAKNDLNATKAVLRTLPDRDWMTVDADCYSKIEACDDQIEEKDAKIHESQDLLASARQALSVHQDFTPVTKVQVDAQRARVEQLSQQVDDLSQRIEADANAVTKLLERINKIAELQKEHNLVDIKRRLEAFRTLESSVIALKHSHEKESSALKHQERSLKILDDVPCGDRFPGCKFIKDAYLLKDKVDPQKEKARQALEKLQRADDALAALRGENLIDKVNKIEQLNQLHSRLQVEISQKRLALVKQETGLESLVANLEPARSKLQELEEALKNEENAEVVALRSEIDGLLGVIKRLDTEKLALATERGRIQTLIDKHAHEREQRQATLDKMRAYELIVNAFSRRGIPSVIIRSQLPLINAEIAKILIGIVDFTVEVESDEDNDSSEVYINYGDSKRIIELGSGMEKMVASVAIRVALINVSSLPKTDMFIIDEGFGALDDSGVEACNRLLSSLKRYFKTIIVITHVEGVKDAADTVIEVTKNEKDARVTYV